MNTTNLLTDYVISGILGILSFLLPYIMIDYTFLYIILNQELKNGTLIALLATIITYAFGILFNQFSDILEEFYFKVLNIDIIKKSELNLKNILQVDHHYALQVIVCKSESAYDYLSFRRTMIRIIRSTLIAAIFLPFFHFLFSLIFLINGKNLSFSLSNLLICILFILVSLFSGYILKKLYKGYYSAIVNFYKVIKDI